MLAFVFNFLSSEFHPIRKNNCQYTDKLKCFEITEIPFKYAVGMMYIYWILRQFQSVKIATQVLLQRLDYVFSWFDYSVDSKPMMC